MNISDAIRLKRAVRQFQDKSLPAEAVQAILNAGRRAQSAKNTQPWHFIAIQDKNILRQLSEYAALGVAIVTPPPESRFSVMFDAGQAAAYMQLAAWEMGIGSCLATIYEMDQARRLLDFPLNLTLYIAISFGYPLDEAVLTVAPKKGGRRTVDETVHWNKW
jgi:nitroreductase